MNDHKKNNHLNQCVRTLLKAHTLEKTHGIDYEIDAEIEDFIRKDESKIQEFYSSLLQAFNQHVRQKSSHNSLYTKPALKQSETKHIPLFSIPNCRIGQSFQSEIRISNAKELEALGHSIEIKAINVTSPNDVSQFKNHKNIISGIPLIEGDIEIIIYWDWVTPKTSLAEIPPHKMKWQASKIKLISNPDPKSLWKIKEPSDKEPYQKEHSAHIKIETPTQLILAASRRGRSHEHEGLFRDDDFYVNHLENGWSITIVADGAGSAKYSRKGSELAVNAAGEYLKQKLCTEQPGNPLDSDKLCKFRDDDLIRKKVSEKIRSILFGAVKTSIDKMKSFSDQENLEFKTLSTTLLIAIVKKENEDTFIATFGIGDGAIAAYGPGKVRLMCSPDNGESAGQTRFLDEKTLSVQEFPSRTYMGLLSDVMSTILVTDGVSDPFFETDNALRSGEIWDSFWSKEIAPLLETNNPELSLLEWLHFNKPGYHDDRTISILLNKKEQ